MSAGWDLDLWLIGLLAATAALLFWLRPRAAESTSPAAAGGKGFARRARRAGYDAHALRLPWRMAQVALALLLPLGVSELAGGDLPLAVLLLLGVAGAMVPEVWLLVASRRRRTRIRRGLSFFLDLLVALLQSGLSLEEALRRAGRHAFAERHPLADEIGVLGRELDAGGDREAAFAALAARTGVPDLQAVAGALALGSRSGVSLTEALASQAELQRQRRLEDGRRRIDRSLLMALLPVMLAGFPLFLLLVALPAVLELLETLRVLTEVL